MKYYQEVLKKSNVIYVDRITNFKLILFFNRNKSRVKKIMSNFIEEYEFKDTPKEIVYFDEEPLKLNNEFCFFHNKSSFRKHVNPLQYMFKTYVKQTLVASGIRDSYLREDLTENFLFLIFSTPAEIRNTNEIVDPYTKKEYPSGHYFIESTSEYILVIAKDMDGITSGLVQLEDIFKQTFENYLKQEQFDDYIKIRPFKLADCSKSS